MKQDINDRTNSKSQVPTTFKNAFSGMFKKLLRVKPNCDTFLTQITDKAPPGHSRSPGTGRCLTPIGNSAEWPSSKSLYINELQQFNTIINYYKHIILKIMKTQIFFLIAAVLVTTNAFGQMKAGSAPLPLVGCTNDFLHPLAGVSYNYQATVNPTGGNFQWWATKNVDFITTTGGVTTNNIGTRLTVGTDLIAASASYGTTTATDNVDITWSSATLSGTSAANPTFVVVQNNGTGTNCANNLKVYPILPINGFTVDIKNMDQAKAPLAYAAPYSFCVSNIASARYDGVTKAIITDYGTNVLYFEVVAANFTGSYTPSFKVSGLAAGQTVTAVDLFADAAFATAAIPTTLTAGVYSPAAPLTVDPSVTNTATGVSIYVRLTIHNGTHETLADDAIVLAVNGINAAGEKDVVNTACGTQTDYEDTATQTLTRRPTITAAAGAFVTP